VIFTAAATALFAGTALAGTFAVGATAFGLQMAAGIGLSYAAQAIAGKPASQQQAANRVGGIQGKLQGGGEVPRSFPVGDCYTKGSLVWANSWGNDGDTPNAYFTQVIALSDLPTTLAGFLVNDQSVSLASSDALTERGLPVLEYRKDGKDHLWIKFYDGTQTTADAFVANNASSAERPYGPDRVGYGCAYAIVTWLTNDELFGKWPEFGYKLNSVRWYDPSRDSTVGGVGPQRWADKSTWGGDGDNLPVVQAYNIKRGIFFEGQWLYGLQSTAAAQLPPAAWIEAINACRDPIERENGFEPTYRAAHECRVNARIDDTIEMLLTACHGKMSEAGGAYKPRVGRPGAPVLHFTDADIIATEEQTLTPFFGLSKTINGIAATYPEPAEGWAMKAAPTLLVPELEERDDNRRLLADVKFDAVPYAAQVQHLMKSALEEAQRARRHTHTMPPWLWGIEAGDVVSWTSAEHGYIVKLFRIDGCIDKANLDVMIDCTEVDPNDHNYNHDIDFTPVPRNPIGFVRPAAQGIVDWHAEPAIIFDEDGISRRPSILLGWDGSVVADIAAVQFEARNDFGTKDVIHRGRTEMVSAGKIRISQNMLPATKYEVRGRYMPANPRETLWSDWIKVTTPDVSLSIYDFGASLKYQMRELQDLMQSQIDDLKAKLKAAGNQDARNWSDKREIRGQIAAQFDKSYALVEQVQTVAVNTQQSLASYTITTNARVAELETSVTVIQGSVADISGWAASQYAVRLDTNGHVTEFGLFNGGPGTGTATFRVDKFEMFLNGVGNKAPFVAGTINGTATFGFAGNMVLDGEIKAWHLAVGSINAGHIQAGTIGTNQLAVGGVDIVNLIAGAATKVTSHDGGNVYLTSAGPIFDLVSSGALNFPVSCNVVVLASMLGNGGSSTLLVPGTPFYPSEAREMIFGLYVDDALVPGSERTYTWINSFTGGYVFPIPNFFDMIVIGETVIPAGFHTVKIRARYARFDSGLTDPRSPPRVTSTKMILTQNRR
jgi:hypothetical protein